jgi:hypothetical protein
MNLRIKFHTGPTQVETQAQRAEQSGRIIGPVVRGTEHVYFTVEGRSISDGRAVAEQILGQSCHINVAPEVK